MPCPCCTARKLPCLLLAPGGRRRGRELCALMHVVGASLRWLGIWTLPPPAGFGGRRFKQRVQRDSLILGLTSSHPVRENESIRGNRLMLGSAHGSCLALPTRLKQAHGDTHLTSAGHTGCCGPMAWVLNIPSPQEQRPDAWAGNVEQPWR